MTDLERAAQILDRVARNLKGAANYHRSRQPAVLTQMVESALVDIKKVQEMIKDG